MHFLKSYLQKYLKILLFWSKFKISFRIIMKIDVNYT